MASHAFLAGRRVERAELQDALSSTRPELIAVHGRRRVGKTYLIRTVFAEQLCFELTGMRDVSLKVQLANFNCQSQSCHSGSVNEFECFHIRSRNRCSDRAADDRQTLIARVDCANIRVTSVLRQQRSTHRGPPQGQRQ